jgi:acyl-CoA synthetase (AMP-forming)/AMP-acid ligase II
MLADHFQSIPVDRRDVAALIAGSDTLTYGQVAARAQSLAGQWRALRGLRIGLALADPAEHLPAVIALDSLGCHAFLAGRRPHDELEQLARRFHWQVLIRTLADPQRLETQQQAAPPDVGHPPGRGLVTLLTSGTTGEPKAANHSWATLAAPARRATRYAGARWLCAYPLNLYAGTQVMLQALLNWSTLVILTSLDPQVVARTLREAGVTHAAGTPTFWRQLLLFAPREELVACRLEQITMGGEPVTQGLLDQLRALFPGTRLIHIYASTELGRLFSVSDGREGFPAGYLECPPENGIELRIVDGELFARSGNAMLGYDAPAGATHGAAPTRPDQWVATGDLVEIEGGRVLFRGRRTDVINVGGRKVLPALVESVLRSAAGVGDIRVYGRRSSLAGQIVAADVVLARGADEQVVRGEINRLARDRLASHEVPRLVRIVDAVAQNEAMKVRRTEKA